MSDRPGRDPDSDPLLIWTPGQSDEAPPREGLQNLAPRVSRHGISAFTDSDLQEAFRVW